MADRVVPQLTNSEEFQMTWTGFSYEDLSIVYDSVSNTCGISVGSAEFGVDGYEGTEADFDNFGTTLYACGLWTEARAGLTTLLRLKAEKTNVNSIYLNHFCKYDCATELTGNTITLDPVTIRIQDPDFSVIVPLNQDISVPGINGGKINPITGSIEHECFPDDEGDLSIGISPCLLYMDGYDE